MKTSKNSRTSTIIIASCILIIIAFIKLATFYPAWIEKNYSRGIYRTISSVYRAIFGWVPFSVGDILYAAAALFLLYNIVKLLKKLKKRRFEKEGLKRTSIKIFFLLSTIYIYFNVSWGLNYNRPGITRQLNLAIVKPTKEELILITDSLVKKVNECRLMLGDGEIKYDSYQQIFSKGQLAYQQATGAGLSFLNYNHISVKRSMYGRIGNFIGILGYYNPFTGEAQLNVNMPRFLIPYITCHEIAHQLGYASESEANFVAYLAAVSSSDTLFRYSTYFDLFNYANKELYSKDSASANRNYKRLSPWVKHDVEELRNYLRKTDNAFEPLIRSFYDRYLKANEQKEGVKSYNRITGWLIAYLNKYGKI